MQSKWILEANFRDKTQFQIEDGGLVQGVTKLITILLTFVIFNKTMPIKSTKKVVDSWYLGRIWF